MKTRFTGNGTSDFKLKPENIKAKKNAAFQEKHRCSGSDIRKRNYEEIFKTDFDNYIKCYDDFGSNSCSGSSTILSDEEQDDHSVYGKNCKTYDVSENMAWLFCIRSGQS